MLACLVCGDIFADDHAGSSPTNVPSFSSSWLHKTYLAALFISMIIFLPAGSALGYDSLFLVSRRHADLSMVAKREQIRLYWIMAGCWLASFILPLDWQKDYQKWPSPVVFGALCGSILGSAHVLVSSLLH